MMRNLPFWLIASSAGFIAAALGAVYNARTYKRSKAMTRITDPRAARAHLLRFSVRVAVGIGIVMAVVYMLVGLLILLVQPDSLGQSVLGAFVTGVSTFVGYWVGFFIYDRLAP